MTGPPKELQLVAFRLDRRLYGVDIMQVHRVLAAQEPVAVPGAPAHVLGMVEVHGELVALLDLRRLVGLPAAGEAGRRLLVLQWAGRRVAFVVDAVEARLRVAPDELLGRPDEVGVEAVTGAFRAGEELGLLLDPARLRIEGLDGVGVPVRA